MSFHSPYLLWLLVPLLLLFSWELARRVADASSDRPKIRRGWAGPFAVTLGARHTTAATRPRLWLWFGLAFAVVALARPQWGVVEEKVFDQSREVLLALDLSRSMLAQDVKPSRLDRAKLLITALLDNLKGERVGLVLFAGTSFLQSPLSADYEILRELLPSLQPDYLPEGGSNYTAMLDASIEAFGTSTADRYLIILSDGESTDESWRDRVEKLRVKGIRVLGLGIGTAQGSFIPDGSGGFIKDERGAVVLSRLNSSTLHELAQATGGLHVEAGNWVDLPALLRRTVEAGRTGEFSEKGSVRRVERYQWFLAVALLLLCLSYWAEFPVRPRDRNLPLGTGRRDPRDGARPASILALLSLVAFGIPLPAPAAESPDDALAKPLTTTVARLAEKPALTAKDYADLAQTSLTYGQRLKNAQQHAPEGVIRDALTAVEAGAKLDSRAADWEQLRRDLTALLAKPEEKEKPEEQPQDQQKNEQQKQNQKQRQQSSQDRQDSQDQSAQDQQQDPSQPAGSEEKQDGQKQSAQDAFGDMQQPPQPESGSAEEKEDGAPPPQQTQRVGGHKDRPAGSAESSELALPLQKLEQVREQDAPARLHMLMQGQQSKPTKKGRDW